MGKPGAVVDYADTLLAQLLFRTGHFSLVRDVSYTPISYIESYYGNLPVAPNLKMATRLFYLNYLAKYRPRLGEIMGRASPTVLDLSGVVVAPPTFLEVLPGLLEAFWMQTSLVPETAEKSCLVLGDIPGVIDAVSCSADFQEALVQNAAYLPATIDMRGVSRGARLMSGLIQRLKTAPNVKRVLVLGEKSLLEAPADRPDASQTILGIFYGMCSNKALAEKMIVLTREETESGFRPPTVQPDQYEWLAGRPYFDTFLETHRAYYGETPCEVGSALADLALEGGSAAASADDK